MSAAVARIRYNPRDMFRLLACAEPVYSGHAFGWFRMDLQQTLDTNVSGVGENARLSCGAKFKKKETASIAKHKMTVGNDENRTGHAVVAISSGGRLCPRQSGLADLAAVAAPPMGPT